MEDDESRRRGQFGMANFDSQEIIIKKNKKKNNIFTGGGLNIEPNFES